VNAVLEKQKEKVDTEQKVLDVVYLKNGNIIKGHIIEQIPGETIKIETLVGDIIVLKFSEIRRIEKQ